MSKKALKEEKSRIACKKTILEAHFSDVFNECLIFYLHNDTEYVPLIGRNFCYYLWGKNEIFTLRVNMACDEIELTFKYFGSKNCSENQEFIHPFYISSFSDTLYHMLCLNNFFVKDIDRQKNKLTFCSNKKWSKDLFFYDDYIMLSSIINETLNPYKKRNWSSW